jgi:putative transposase
MRSPIANYSIKFYLRSAVKISKANQAHGLQEAKPSFAADNRKAAIIRFKTLETRWLVEEKGAVKWMKKDLFNCRHFYNFPLELWKSIRATNILERPIREVRRRTRPLNNFFTDETGSDRVMYGISQMLNKGWRDETLNQNITI